MKHDSISVKLAVLLFVFLPTGVFAQTAGTFQDCVDDFESSLFNFVNTFENSEETFTGTCFKTTGKDGMTIAARDSIHKENFITNITIGFSGSSQNKVCEISFECTDSAENCGTLEAHPSHNFQRLLSGKDVSLWNKYLESGEGCKLVMENPHQKIVFVTSLLFTGDLVTEANNLIKGKRVTRTGLESGNAICNKLASDANLPGSYTAWLSGFSMDAIDRVTNANVPYVLPNGTKVADNFADILDCGDGSQCLDNPINVDENSALVTTVADRVLTGTAINGRTKNDLHCGEWTQTQGSGIMGEAEFSGISWTGAYEFGHVTIQCTGTGRLYCFQD